jgi:protein-tyrosine phosphatase
MSNQTQFENLLNFRDVGAYINSIVGSQVLKPTLLFRSARPDEATPADRNQLVNHHKIKTIIDLRSNTEHINAAKKRAELSLADQSAAAPSSVDAVAKAAQIPGIRYANVNLNGKGFERHLIWQLKYTSLAKLVFLMALGYRTQGISVLGKELMLPRGLTGLGIDTLDHSGPEFKDIFDLLADKKAWPIMLNCTQGKDRTGITVLLILLLCGITIQAITQDYVLSEQELEPEKAARMEEIASIGLDESFARCPDDFCEIIVQHIDSKYGGIQNYLRSIGIQDSQLETIKTILTNDPTNS